MIKLKNNLYLKKKVSGRYLPMVVGAGTVGPFVGATVDGGGTVGATVDGVGTVGGTVG